VFPLLLVAFGGLVGFIYFFRSVPLPGEADVYQAATVVSFADGSELGTLQPEYEREDVALAELPPHVIDAVLVAEDAQFREHVGLSLPGLFRAAFRNLVSGEIRQGGSTITQQYVKNAILGDNSRTVLRKVHEAVLAVKLERQYSKDEILEFYLNTIYLGRGAYGIQAAARAYFGVEARDLLPDQAALLAGMIAAPSSSDPVDEPERAAERYRYVLDRLLTEGLIDAVEAGRLRAGPLPPTIPRNEVRFTKAPFFLQMVEAEVARALGDEQIYSGLQVTTTLDPRLQELAQTAYDGEFDALDGPTGALVALSPRTGGIAALVGGENYSADQLNLATRPQQPGSTFKTFALAAWVEDGKSPESYFDAPAEYAVEGVLDEDGQPYVPGNYEGASFDPMSLRVATWRSVNTVYLQVAEKVGPAKVAEMATRAGIHEGLPAVASLVLGSVEVTPLELAEAYNTFAARGVHREPFAVSEVRRGDEVLYTRPPQEDRAFSEGVAATVTNVLQGVVLSGTGTRARIGVPAAGKTGTTDSYGDAWFAGYTPELAAVVWMGNRDNNATMPGEPTGGDLPARLWASFMQPAHEGLDVPNFPPAPGGLTVTRGSPAPTPTACPDGEVLTPPSPEAEDAAPVCAPSPAPSPSASPSLSPSPSPSPGPSVVPSPEPSQPPTAAPPSPPPSPAQSSSPPPASAPPSPAASPAPQPSPAASSAPAPQPSPTPSGQGEDSAAAGTG